MATRRVPHQHRPPWAEEGVTVVEYAIIVALIAAAAILTVIALGWI